MRNPKNRKPKKRNKKVIRFKGLDYYVKRIQKKSRYDLEVISNFRFTDILN